MLSVADSNDFIVHHGSKFTYPTFQTIITERQVTQKRNYYCVLAEQDRFGTHITNQYDSTYWPSYPIVKISSDVTKAIQDEPYTFGCSILNFDNQGKNYSVQFNRMYQTNSQVLAFYDEKCKCL